MKECQKLLTEIVTRVKDVGKRYCAGNCEIEECIRSPHHRRSEIDLIVIQENVKREKGARMLVCPDTKSPTQPFGQAEFRLTFQLFSRTNSSEKLFLFLFLPLLLLPSPSISFHQK